MQKSHGRPYCAFGPKAVSKPIEQVEQHFVIHEQSLRLLRFRDNRSPVAEQAIRTGAPLPRLDGVVQPLESAALPIVAKRCNARCAGLERLTRRLTPPG